MRRETGRAGGRGEREKQRQQTDKGRETEMGSARDREENGERGRNSGRQRQRDGRPYQEGKGPQEPTVWDALITSQPQQGRGHHQGAWKNVPLLKCCHFYKVAIGLFSS